MLCESESVVTWLGYCDTLIHSQQNTKNNAVSCDGVKIEKVNRLPVCRHTGGVTAVIG
jgi:hypothetical protein